MTDLYYQKECNRIIEKHREKIKKVFDYKYSELEFDFLGFLESYEPFSNIIPLDFTIIDLGCYQAVQAVCFENYARYIGVDIGCPVSSRFEQDNAEYYCCTIQDFYNKELPKLNLNPEKVFVICSYVPDKEAQDIACKFKYNYVVYCNDVISKQLPEGIK